MTEHHLLVPEGWRLVSLTHYRGFGHWLAYCQREEPLLTEWGWNIIHCTWCYKHGKGETPQAAILASVELGSANLESLRLSENAVPPEQRKQPKGISPSPKVEAATQDLLDLLDL
jgi:hypothetical protein